jgi:membrane associated rhomboid family serine protease
MGLYDREYYREEKPGIRLGGDWSAVTTLIVINIAVFLAEIFTQQVGQHSWLEENLGLQPDFFHHPWTVWQLLTYGFIHDSTSLWHVGFNMLGLWIFGSEVETVYGKREFLKLYTSLIILAGLFNTIIEFASGHQSLVIGASGGVMGVAVIFACHFPKRTMYVWPIPLPIPAYVLVTAFILLDFLGTFSAKSETAHWVHLGGAAFGFLYYRTGWSLFRLWPRGWTMQSIRFPMGKPKFRIHREPEEDDTEQPVDDYLTTGRLQKRVDELLEKISRSGEGSLNEEERQFLADASRRYQQHRRR